MFVKVYGVGLKSNDLGVSPYLSFAISASVEVFAYILTQMVLDRLGRKLPYCTFLFIGGVSCFLITFTSKPLLLKYHVKRLVYFYFLIENVYLVLILAMIGKVRHLCDCFP